MTLTAVLTNPSVISITEMRIARGSIVNKIFTVKAITFNSDGTRILSTAPTDITAATFIFVVKQKRSSTTEYFRLTVGSGITISTQAGATLGQIVVAILASHTETLAPGHYVYELWCTLAGETEPVIDESPFVVEERIPLTL